jgi:hypothetical protein
LRIEDEDKQGWKKGPEKDQHERQHGGCNGEGIGKRERANRHHELISHARGMQG